MNVPGRKLQVWIAVAALPALLGGAYALQWRIDARVQTLEAEQEVLLVSSPALIKKLSLGYEALLADIYWTRVVQYYGGKRRDHDPNFQLLAPLLEITTTLDPQLLIAYKFGAIFLTEPPPRGAGRPDLAVTLVQKGIRANPDEWRLWADLGFIYYADLRDYQKAAAAYLEGSKNPKARDWMKVMAARIAQEGGSRDISIFLWSQVYDSTQDPSIRKNALEHLQALRAEQDMEELEKLAAQYAHRTGQKAGSTRDLVAAGLLRGIPVDPTGVPYAIGPDGHVKLGPASKVNLDILKAITP